MVIITDGQQAVITYSDSQWLDARDAAFPEGYCGYQVPNQVATAPILGSPQVMRPDESCIEKIAAEAVEPMGHAEVEALAVDVVLLAGAVVAAP